MRVAVRQPDHQRPERRRRERRQRLRDPIRQLGDPHVDHVGRHADHLHHTADTLLQQTLQSVQNSDFLDGHALLEQDNITLPIFGTGSVNSHQRKLLVILAISGMALVGSFGWVLRENDRAAQQVAATGQALMQAQRVAKSGTQALLGVPHAFIELKDGIEVIQQIIKKIISTINSNNDINEEENNYDQSRKAP